MYMFIDPYKWGFKRHDLQVSTLYIWINNNSPEPCRALKTMPLF